MISRLFGKRMLVFLSGIMISISLPAGEVILYGKAADWSKTIISFYRYKELVTWSEDLLAEAKITDTGSFEIKIHVDETAYIFV